MPLPPAVTTATLSRGGSLSGIGSLLFARFRDALATLAEGSRAHFCPAIANYWSLDQ
jgi:hypothetical protein